MSHVLRKVIPNLSVDCVIFGFERGRLEVLLVRRAIAPQKGMWALPGGFVLKRERVARAAGRVLEATTGVEGIYMEEVGIFDTPDRYPLRRVLTVGYFALVRPERYALHPGVDTSAVQWHPLDVLPALPFDHRQIIDDSLGKLRVRLRTRPIGFELLPRKFSLPQIQRLYEAILAKPVDKRNFRKKLLKMNLVHRLREREKGAVRRAAYLYAFDVRTYEHLREQGFVFDL
jgi:8-oxo-dGTP diphosphatase